MIMKFSGMSTITSFSGIGFGSYMRFMAVARVAWASLEMDPKLMAPVNYWFNIFKMCNLTRKFTSQESLDNFGSRFDIFNANRLARRNDFQLASQSALAQAFHAGLLEAVKSISAVVLCRFLVSISVIKFFHLFMINYQLRLSGLLRCFSPLRRQ
jgi:hypothetical protein